ncbi:capsule biosynthesis protein [uncultured Paracoccus sp.]|uniref:capsule biosynthesis protein n=1 Tax=uncultured Paracoccus sp. TaxID=189685 RepID=UPI0025E107D5|nr:capsule biosynthesis protein [uncultured Paracoccus sp.]
MKAQAPQSQAAQPETAEPQAAQAETTKPDAPGRRARAAGRAAPAERERPARIVKEQPAKPLQARAVAARQQTTLPDAAPQPKPVAKPQPAGDKAPPASPSVRAPVQAAQPQRRHWILLASFVAMVVLPTLIAAWYLWARATDQYVSTVGFSVRHEDAQPAIDLLGGLAAFGGSAAGASDTDILYQYILSTDMVETVDRQLDLRTRFARQWPNDFVFAYNPEGTIEDLTDYWQRQVNVIYDSSVGLITLNVSAFDPQDAQQIAQAILDESTARINELSSIAHDDATRLAREELEKARVELTAARQEMTAFRIHTQIVDPQADLAGQMGVLAGLQTQLAEQMVSHDLLMENAPPTDNRVIQSQQRIDALERLIERERAKFSQDGHGPGGESYAQLVAEFEKLTVDREFAEGAYRSARVAYESALAEAQRQSRYLAAHINPRVPQASTQPHRLRLLGLTAGLLLIAWSIMTLVYYSVRDRG